MRGGIPIGYGDFLRQDESLALAVHGKRHYNWALSLTERIRKWAQGPVMQKAITSPTYGDDV